MRAKLWNRGLARTSLMGNRDDTSNPTPAAKALLRKGLGARRYTKAVKRSKRRRSYHRGNPAPAALGVLAGLFKGKLGQRLTGSPRYDGGPLVTTVQSFLERIQKGGQEGLAAVQQLHREATNVSGKHRMQWAKVWNTELPALGGALKPAIRAEIKRLDPTALVATGAERATASDPNESALARAAQGLAPVVIRETLKASKPRARYQNYIDAAGVLRRRKVTPRAPRLPTGGAAAVRGGASQLGRAALGAGVAIGGLAAGYYVGSKLNKYLAGRALGKEQAGVAAALALREARAEATAAKGSALTAAEARSLGAEYKAQLLQLGYDPVTFTRSRSIVERFFTGQEED